MTACCGAESMSTAIGNEKEKHFSAPSYTCAMRPPPRTSPPPRPPPASPHTPSVSFGFPPPHFCVPPHPPVYKHPSHVSTRTCCDPRDDTFSTHNWSVPALIWEKYHLLWEMYVYLVVHLPNFLVFPQIHTYFSQLFWEMSDNNLGEVIKSWEKSFFSQ
jgi:hypothetical protein